MRANRTRRDGQADHDGRRVWFRRLGLVFALGGAALVVVGFSRLIGNPGHFAIADIAWPIFTGMPLLAVGTMLLKLGYFGAVLRYVATETTPVGVTATREYGRGIQGTVRDLAAAAAAGMRGEGGTSCAGCGADNPPAARFCNQCGESLGGATCTQCRAPLAAAAAFCGSCGAKVATRG